MSAWFRTPPIYFAIGNRISEYFIEAANLLEQWTEAILQQGVEFIGDDENVVSCSRTGDSCSPVCKLFDPEKACHYSDLKIKTYSLPDVILLLNQKQYEKREKWRLFYRCFHPKSEEKTDEKKQAVVEFPDDQPNVPDSAIKETIKNAPKEKDNPAYWSKQRMDVCFGGDKVMRRIAMSDWYWQWFKKVAEPKNIKVNKEVARNKHKLDQIMGERFGDKFSDDMTISVQPDWPEYQKIVSLITKLGGVQNTGIKIKVVADLES